MLEKWKFSHKCGRKMLINLAIAVCFILSLGACSANNGHAGEERKIAYSANLTVTMTEKGLIGSLQGDTWDNAHTKRVDVEKDGQELTYLFFYFSGNWWDGAFTDKNSYVDYTICPEDKEADQVDYVYYYTGDYSGIEMMEYEQLQEVVKESVLLWSSEETP